MAQSAQPQQISPQQQNMLARNAVIRQGVNMWLPISTTNLTAANGQGPGTTINIPPRNVGLIKRFVIQVSGLITTTAQMALSANGGGNFFSKVEFTDLSNQQRISTNSWHLQAVSSAKRRRPYGTAGTSIDNPYGYGENYHNVFAMDPIPIGTNEFDMFFEVPVAYTDHDLRGSIYANVTNAVMNLSLTINPQLFTVTGSVGEQRGMYVGAAGAGTLTSVQIIIHQNFLDQLPIAQQGGPVLPLLDLSTAYLLNNTAVSGVVNNQDNPIPFANFRDFMSACVIYDDPAAYVALGGPSPIDYFALQSANYTNIFKEGPYKNYHDSRLIIGDDFPKGTHYFDFRDKPVSTIQYGNMELLVHPKTVTNNNTTMLIGFESLALINMITQAGSLYGT
jgi:hypothetical protein